MTSIETISCDLLEAYGSREKERKKEEKNATALNRVWCDYYFMQWISRIPVCVCFLLSSLERGTLKGIIQHTDWKRYLSGLGLCSTISTIIFIISNGDIFFSFFYSPDISLRFCWQNCLSLRLQWKQNGEWFSLIIIIIIINSTEMFPIYGECTK